MPLPRPASLRDLSGVSRSLSAASFPDRLKPDRLKRQRFQASPPPVKLGCLQSSLRACLTCIYKPELKLGVLQTRLIVKKPKVTGARAVPQVTTRTLVCQSNLFSLQCPTEIIKLFHVFRCDIMQPCWSGFLFIFIFFLIEFLMVLKWGRGLLTNINEPSVQELHSGSVPMNNKVVFGKLGV